MYLKQKLGKNLISLGIAGISIFTIKGVSEIYKAGIYEKWLEEVEYFHPNNSNKIKRVEEKIDENADSYVYSLYGIITSCLVAVSGGFLNKRSKR